MQEIALRPITLENDTKVDVPFKRIPNSAAKKLFLFRNQFEKFIKDSLLEPRSSMNAFMSIATTKTTGKYSLSSGLITLSLNLLMMIIAFFLAHFFGSGIKQKKTIAIECGLQNGTLAIFVGTIMFGGGIYIIPAATYSLIMFATSIVFVLFLRNSN